MRRRSRLTHAFLFCLGSICLFASVTTADEIKGRISWPREWTVFAPFDRSHPVPDSERLHSIPNVINAPETVTASAHTAEGRKIEVQPGEPFDLAELLGDPFVRQVAYVFLELDSPQDQTATIGMGADWWLQAWVNGEEVFSTLDRGNVKTPISILNYQVDVPLMKGSNVLAVRFIAGAATAQLALGGPGEFPAAERHEAERLAARDLNILPKRLEDRLLFPVEEQAVAMARRGMELPGTDADLSGGELVGLRPMPERQLYFRPLSETRGELLDTVSRRFDVPVTIRLSKSCYPWEDRHLDAIVWTTPPEEGRLPRGRLEVILRDSGGATQARHEISDLSPSGLFFSLGLPEALRGSNGSLEVVWRQGDNEVGRAEAPFRVYPPSDVKRSGRVPLRILNEQGATLPNAPMTVGVPFPRGALQDEANVRIIDENGTEMPLQTRVTGKWSRFGPIKWLLCDFTVDLDGEPREVQLEYGPNVQRAGQPDIANGGLAGGFPELDAGRVRINEDGLSFDAAGNGNFQTVLSPQAMRGAFVRHEDGRTYTMPAEAEYAFEELGSEKAVVRRTGWYFDPASGEKFCQFVTRFVFHRDSPVVRVFHTWIFTGDGNADRIADMGWRFDAAQSVSDGAILTAFDNGDWLSTESLVQFDFDHFLLPHTGTERKGRTPGVLSAVVGDSRVTFGGKDFWQNFPSELEILDGGFAFYNWPKRNPPARFERPVARDDAFRHRFVHEGQLLDFRIPDEYAEGEIWRESSSREGHWAEGRPETANAQGIARTEEMFLYFTEPSTSADEAAKVIQGLNDESLRAVADPAWMCASGTFAPMHHRDPEKYPEDERIYEKVTLAPTRWVERLGFYGMWLHGDYPTWSINLTDRTVSTYRTLRKNHHTFPYRWVPFVRSGDPRLLKLAGNAARQMTDANFCHYATADVDESVGPEHFRRQGWWDRSLLPWAARRGPRLRSYTVDSDYLWQAYYLTGYGRARDVALLFGELTQRDYTAPTLVSRESSGVRSRTTESMLFSYVHMFQATFDPWFLDAAYEIASLHAHLYGHFDIDKETARPDKAGSFWRGADHEFYRLTEWEDFERAALNNARAWASPRSANARAGTQAEWHARRTGAAEFAWRLTDDDFYLARAAAALDVARTGFYEGPVDYFLGSTTPMIHGIFAPAWIVGMPRAMAALESAGHVPDLIPDSFPMPGEYIMRDDEEAYNFRHPRVLVRKDSQPLRLLLDQRNMQQKALLDIAGPDGDSYLSESWLAPKSFEIPAEAPRGVYKVSVSGRFDYPEGVDRARFRRQQGGVFFPLGDYNVPEVVDFGNGETGASVPAAGRGWWFYMPEDLEEFWIEFSSARWTNRLSVWNPDGDRVWDGYGENEAQRAELTVPNEHAGRLWRVTGGSFQLDPRIPPYLSVSRPKWFDPEN